MDHPKLSPADNILTSSFTPSPQQKDRLSSAEDVAVVKIAQRFAPGVQSVVAPNDRGFDRYAPRPVPSLASSPGIRALIAVLIIVALFPSLIFGAMLWLGLVSTHLSTTMAFDRGPRPSVQSASVAGVPLSAREQLGSAEIWPGVLTAPVTLETKAGEDIPFTIALSRTAALPARSTIDINGLPHGSTLSSGRPYGEEGWNLRSDEVGGLRLILPEAARGETRLVIRLIAPDGESIAKTETILTVTPEPSSSAETAVSSRDAEGAPELEVADLSGVRPFFGSASENGSHDAMLALGAPDEVILAPRSGPSGITVEPPRAQGGDQAQGVAPSSLEAKPSTPEGTEVKDEPVQSATSPPAQSPADGSHSWITLSEFVNLREGPSSSTRVIGVIEKGSKLRAIGRKRGWVQVTDTATSETGWIYSRYAVSGTKPRRAIRKAAPSRLGPESDGLFWTRLGQWVMGP